MVSKEKKGDKMDWLREAIDGYKNKVELGLELYGDLESAIQYANDNSTAGAKAKSIALEEIKGAK